MTATFLRGRKKERKKTQFFISRSRQDCQIFLGTKYQNEGKYTKLSENISNGQKIYQMAVK
jgi:hypothetical protein